jgi:hypothetical protein
MEARNRFVEKLDELMGWGVTIEDATHRKA